MRIFVVLLMAVGFIVVMIQRDGKTAPAKAKPVAVLASAKATPAPNEHNWPKNSLDRANDVKRQVLEQRKANGVN